MCTPHIFVPIKEKANDFKIFLGAQNISKYTEGAFTGDISISMIKDAGATYCIVGHSERRNFGSAGGENDKDINEKIKLLLKYKIVPILCVGERVRDSKHTYFNFIKKQLHDALDGVPKTMYKNIVIAYEPIWAIGKDAVRDAKPVEVNEMVIFIRKCISDLSRGKVAQDIKVIYGGSVNTNNIIDLLELGGMDGFLVGRASLSTKDFTKIIELSDITKSLV